MIITWNWFVSVSSWLYISLFVAYGFAQLYGSMVVSAQFFTPVKCRGHKESNAIAITFDDGPWPLMTEKILDILSVHQVYASFFCIGDSVSKHPAILKKMHEQGHLIGNHSFFHGKLFDLQSSGKMHQELRETDHVIEKAIGVKPRLFRPPYGVTNPNLAKAIRMGNYLSVGWSVRSLDTVIKDEVTLFRRVTRDLQAGDIILFHDYCESTIHILPQLLAYVKNAGLKVVRVDELLNEAAYV